MIAAILKSDTFSHHSFILTQLDWCSLEFCHLGFSHKKTSLIHSDSTWWWQPSWYLPSWIQPFCTKNSQLHSFILTQLDDGSHLEFCHLGFRHCHLGFRHLVIFSQIHWKTLFTPLWLWLKLIQSDSNSFILIHSLNLMMAAILNLDSILDSATLLSSLFSNSHFQDLTLSQTNSSDLT